MSARARALWAAAPLSFFVSEPAVSLRVRVQVLVRIEVADTEGLPAATDWDRVLHLRSPCRSGTWGLGALCSGHDFQRAPDREPVGVVRRRFRYAAVHFVAPRRVINAAVGLVRFIGNIERAAIAASGQLCNYLSSHLSSPRPRALGRWGIFQTMIPANRPASVARFSASPSSGS